VYTHGHDRFDHHGTFTMRKRPAEAAPRPAFSCRALFLEVPYNRAGSSAFAEATADKKVPAYADGPSSSVAQSY
jgi:hypothetical protein